MEKINRRKFLKNTSLIGASVVVMGTTAGDFILRSRGFDVLIKNGSLIDGTGKPEFIAGIGLKDGKIEAIGNLSDAEADFIIDAKGLKVTPGFIDIHSHTDLDLILNPKAESKIRQGVTTEIAGQDGFSLAPVGGPDFEQRLMNFKERYNEDLSWRTFEEFLDNFQKRKFCVNLASMVGLGTLRKVVVGFDDRPATIDEIKKMQELAARAVEAGAVGLSTGLEYTPGSFASTEELIKLCEASPEFARVYATHMRNEDNTVLEAVEEAIKIARESGSRLQISHLKVSGKTNWHKADAVIELMEKAIDEGIEVHADRYTYVAYHTNLSSLFPLWSRDGGTEAFLNRLKDKSLTDKIKEYAETKVGNLDGGWDGVLISSVGKEEKKNEIQGKTIKQISEEKEIEPYRVAVDLLLNTDDNCNMVGFGMEEESTEKILAHPRVMIASDAGSHAPYPPMNKSIAHPRAYGTFPRAIAKYVKERKITSLEEMIKKMTSMPADKLSFTDRGRLEPGKNADVVIFNYDTIKDKATFVEPHQYPEGIPFVIVNGEVVIKDGEHSGAMPGKVVRSKG